MVKEENLEEWGNASKIKIEDNIVPKEEAEELLYPKPPYGFENNHPSSSNSQVKLNLISMGFSSPLVDKAIDKYGEDDVDLIVEFLCSQSVVQTLKSDFDNLDNRHSDHDENASSCELSFSDDGDSEEQKPNALDLDKKHSLLRMNFAVKDVELAIGHLGRDAPLPELIDYIIASQIAGGEHGENVVTTETLFKTMEKSLRLLEMGFTEEEISNAIETFGSDALVDELADSIFAKRFANGCIKEEVDAWPKDARGTNECETKLQMIGERSKRVFADIDPWESKPSTSSDVPHESREVREGKRPRWIPVRDKSTPRTLNDQEQKVSETKQPYFSLETSSSVPLYEEEKTVNTTFPVKALSNKNSNHGPATPAPPYFFFGNVTDSSQETWNKLSRFMHGTEPEHVNTQFFSALIRKEVYFHNLPTDNRSPILPKPEMTIEEALPNTKRWWPSWDTRKQLGSITADISDTARVCERLGRMLVNSKGILTKEEQTDTLHHCKTLNLLWVGENKLRPIEPDNVEYILGYPMEHTRIDLLGDSDRMRALRYSFQIDTLGYHLSPLKQIYPDGLRVLSLFSGIGGAEITLVRLRIPLLCTVSIESSEINRKILKRWWKSTNQTGELRQIDGIEKLTGSRIEKLLDEFGGFDLVISGNPHHYKYGVPRADSPEGVDFSLFLESVRILQRVKSIMSRRQSQVVNIY